MINEHAEQDQIFSKVLRAGRRTYFFDVKSTKSDDYYLTITESKKFTEEDGSFHYKKHKIYLYKEDFAEFNEILKSATDFIIKERGEEVISDRHQQDYIPTERETSNSTDSSDSTDLKFEDI